MLSRLFRVGTTFVVLGLLAVTAQAQPGGGRGGPGGGRGMGARGTASEMLGLLSAPEIRKEVKLSDEGFAEVEKILKANGEAMRSAFQGGFNRDASEEERNKMRETMEKLTKEANEKSQAILDEVLPPEGLDRLLGLYVQLRGDSSIVGELPAKKLALSDADKEKIQEAINKAREEMRGGRGPGGGQPGGQPGGQGGAGGFDRDAMMARFAEMQKKSDEAVQAVLTDAQKKAVADLKGAKFDFPESVRGMGGFGGFGGPGGPGGPGGNRRGGGRPGSESGT